ncbi:MAG: hypothetical protein ACFE9L_10655 [Candidatus Hodarchaeota archaeon]
MLEISSSALNSFCSFCGAKVRDVEVRKCLKCGAIFCAQCAAHLQINGIHLKCPCGSTNIDNGSPTKDLKVETLEHIFELKRFLKQVGYRPVILLKRTGHLESRLRSFRKQFLIPGNQIDHIFLETKKIETFILTEFQEYCAKLKRFYQKAMGIDPSIDDYRNFSMQLTLFQKHITSFDQTVANKLQPIQELIDQVAKQCDEFDEMAKNLGRYFDIFVFVPGELAIGFFPDIDIQNNRIRKSSIDLVITTDRIVIFRKKRAKLLGQRMIIYDEFPTEDLIDVQKTKEGILKRDKLAITTIEHDYELYGDYQTLMRIFDGLQLSYYGRPSELYIHEPFRDWASEIYQEKILSALNFQTDSNKNSNRQPESNLIQEKDPDFVTGVLDERLRDLRIRKLATEKALQELKEGRRKVANRDYFELVKQFELELAKVNEEITELLIRTGKTNILSNF